MKKKTIRNLLISAASLTLTAGVAFAVLPHANALSVAGEEWNAVELEEEYLCGSTLAVPSRTVTAGGQTKAASSVLTFPDGTTSRKTDAVLEMTGNYTITYTAMIGTKVYQTTEEFHVYDTLYKVGESSSVTYEKHALSAETTGLSVRLAQNDTLRFSSIIDLTNVTASDPIVEAFVTPDSIGTMDFKKLIFTLTDIEDPNCYLKISGIQSSDGIGYPYTYFLAGGNNQPMEGWEEGWGKLHINDDWGTPAPHSFYGSYSNGQSTLDHTKISVRYDAKNNAVYTGASQTLVIDLDSSDYFSRLWTGFPSGKARLSVSADIYSSTTANFVISYVKDTDLSATRLEDEDPPVLTVNKPEGTMPDAKVNSSYPIPAATAKDDYSGACAVETLVYYNYTSTDPLNVPVQDGKFTPTNAGRYAIVYRSSDHEGNLAEEVLWVNAANSVPAVSLAVPTDGRVTTVAAGTLVTLPEAQTSGGSGEIVLSVSAALNGDELPIERGTLRPRAAGTCTVTYTATDYIGQTATVSYEITVEKGDKPVFETEPLIPMYFISGSEYEIPAFYASDYTSGTFTETKATLSVTDKNGTRNVTGKFTPEVAANNDVVTLTFRAGEAELVKRIPAIIPMIQVGNRINLVMENYFVTDDAALLSGDDSITVTATAASSGWTFANKLVAENFVLNLRAISAQSKFGGLKITLTDSLDHSIAIEAELVYSGSTSLKVNGNTLALSSGFQSSASSKLFEIGYANGKISVGTTTLGVTETADGKPFAGFPSDYVYLTVEFTDATAGAAYEVTNINGQPISSATSDRIRPKISVLGDGGGVVELGAEVTIPKAVAGDVLDPTVTFTMTVTDGEGNAITDKNGVLLQNVNPMKEYVFVPANYGTHLVTYSATDTFSERTQTYSYAIIVEDRAVPVVTFDREPATTVKVGEVIVIPNYTVSDNVSAAKNLIVNQFVITATGYINVLPEGTNSFRPTQTGEYRIVITVLDEAGNLAMVVKTFTVTE